MKLKLVRQTTWLESPRKKSEREHLVKHWTQSPELLNDDDFAYRSFFAIGQSVGAESAELALLAYAVAPVVRQPVTIVRGGRNGGDRGRGVGDGQGSREAEVLAGGPSRERVSCWGARTTVARLLCAFVVGDVVVITGSSRAVGGTVGVPLPPGDVVRGDTKGCVAAWCIPSLSVPKAGSSTPVELLVEGLRIPPYTMITTSAVEALSAV